MSVWNGPDADITAVLGMRLWEAGTMSTIQEAIDDIECKCRVPKTVAIEELGSCHIIVCSTEHDLGFIITKEECRDGLHLQRYNDMIDKLVPPEM